VHYHQLDLEKEAHNLTEFSSKFALDDWVVFPRPIEGYVSRHVLVETLMEGRPILNFMKLRNEVGEGVRTGRCVGGCGLCVCVYVGVGGVSVVTRAHTVWTPLTAPHWCPIYAPILALI
jgi:hypothetical protein